MISKYLSCFLVFILFLAWLFWGNSWYPIATLKIQGQLSDPAQHLSVRWDAGSGYNSYEEKIFVFTQLPEGASSMGIPVRLTRTGKHKNASLGGEVLLRSIRVDGEILPWQELNLPQSLHLEDDFLAFQEDGASLSLNIKPTSVVQFDFQTFNGAGEVKVEVGGRVQHHDLYSALEREQWSTKSSKSVALWFISGQGDFVVSMPIPRYRVDSFRVASKSDFSLHSMQIQTEYGESFALGIPGETGRQYDIPVHAVYPELALHYHPHRFLLQIFFAFLMTILIVIAYRLAASGHGLKGIFVLQQRYLFWGMVMFSGLVFFLWHLAFWPGVLSNDSLNIWRAAQIPGLYLRDHPALTVFFYTFLSQLWNNEAVVPLVQNFLTSLLIAYIFYTLCRESGQLAVVFPWYFLVVFSVPVGLYTIVLWKDVPFALLAVLLAFKVGHAKFRLATTGKRISWSEGLGMLGIAVLLAGIRHNGILYILLLPCTLMIFGLIRVRSLSLLAGMFVLLIAGSLFFSLAGGKNAYLLRQTEAYVNSAIERLSPQYLKNSLENYFGVFNVQQTAMQWDHLHLCMMWRYVSYPVLKGFGWNDAIGYKAMPKDPLRRWLQKKAWKIYWLTYDTPWVYFSWNPVFMLAVLLVAPCLWRLFPFAAVYSFITLIPVLVLVVLQIFNWRYYYFAFLSSYFVVPILLTEYFHTRQKSTVETEGSLTTAHA